MKGLRVIPAFILLILCSYLGMIFVEQNREMVVVTFGTHHTEPMAMGFVVLTSVLAGMLMCGFLCMIEVTSLYIQNKSLKRRLSLYVGKTPAKGNGKKDLKSVPTTPALPTDRVEPVRSSTET